MAGYCRRVSWGGYCKNKQPSIIINSRQPSTVDKAPGVCIDNQEQEPPGCGQVSRRKRQPPATKRSCPYQPGHCVPVAHELASRVEAEFEAFEARVEAGDRDEAGRRCAPGRQRRSYRQQPADGADTTAATDPARSAVRAAARPVADQAVQGNAVAGPASSSWHRR